MTWQPLRVFVALIVFSAVGGCGEKGPARYVSSARLMLDAKGGVNKGKLKAEVELIQSPEIGQRVTEKLEIVIPPLDLSEVELKINSSLKTASIKLETIGTDPARVEAHLKALVAEYLKFRSQLEKKENEERDSIRVVEEVSGAHPL